MKLRRILILGFALLAVSSAKADEAKDQVTPEIAFFLDLQKAVRTQDRNWLADHLHIPATRYGAKTTVIRNKAYFLIHYSSLIGPKLRAIILAQTPDDLFRNYQGTMIGSGPNIWFRDFGDGPDTIRYEIITINDDE
jgi:hypothetical protein